MTAAMIRENPQIQPAPETLPDHYDSPHIVFGFLFAPLMLFAPRTINRHMVGLPIWKAAVIGAFYFSLAIPFLKPIGYERTIAEIFYNYPLPWLSVTLFLLLIMQWLAVLPFAGRTGSNTTTLMHVTRTVLLMTFWLPLTGIILWNLFPIFNPHIRSFFSADFVAGGSAAILTPIALWTINVIRALGVEYRTINDLSAPHDPYCDECGYDLTMSPINSRCPECGKPVAESLSAAARNPSRWERNPAFFSPSQIAWQIKTLFSHPMTFFSSIPLRTDHAAARRWLMISLLFIGLTASLLGPALLYTDRDPVYFTFNNWVLYGIAYDIGLTWAMLALLMVGIETGGMAIIGTMKNYPIDLASTSKVTSYASIYMLVWVILGSAQILCIYIWMNQPAFRTVSERMQILVTFGSGAFVHIAGLVIFEWVVYSGLRKIQFSNK